MKAFLVAFCALAVAAPAFAQGPDGAAANGGTTASGPSETTESGGAGDARADESERLVCRRVETTSASRMQTRRVCRTAEEWRRDRRAS